MRHLSRVRLLAVLLPLPIIIPIFLILNIKLNIPIIHFTKPRFLTNRAKFLQSIHTFLDAGGM